MTGICGWFLAFLFFLGAECICRCLVSLWFVFGAIAAFLCAVLGIRVQDQLLAFLLSSMAAFFLIRPLVFLERHFAKNPHFSDHFPENRKEGEHPWN